MVKLRGLYVIDNTEVVFHVCLTSDLYGHLHGAGVTDYSKNLSFVDFTKCTMAQSPGKTREGEEYCVL